MTQQRDRDEIIDLASRYGWYADMRLWDRMAELFTPRVLLDNSSMPGGSRVTVDRADMIAGWARMFVAFESTQHMVTNHLVEVDGAVATCTAQFFAQHIAARPMGDPALVIAGHYRFGLIRTDTGWRIESLAITKTWTDGNFAVMTGGPAQEPAPVQDAPAVARKFLQSLDSGDVDAAMSCLADDVVQDMPYSPPGFPKQVRGCDALRILWTGLLKSVGSIDFRIVQVRPFTDPEWVFVEFTADLVQPSGKRYSNHYFSFFHVVGGRVRIYREIYDPLVFTTEVSDEDRAAMFSTPGAQR